MLELECIPWLILFVWIRLFLDNYRETKKKHVLAGCNEVKKLLTFEDLTLQPWTDLLHNWSVTPINNAQVMITVMKKALEEHFTWRDITTIIYYTFKWNDRGEALASVIVPLKPLIKHGWRYSSSLTVCCSSLWSRSWWLCFHGNWTIPCILWWFTDDNTNEHSQVKRMKKKMCFSYVWWRSKMLKLCLPGTVNKTISDELIILASKMKGKYSTLIELRNSVKS